MVRDFGVRSQRTLLLSGITGVLTGGAVAGYDWIVQQELFERVIETPVAVQAALLAVGLLLAAGSLLWIAGGASPATADAYIENFHEPDRVLPLRPVIGRLMAGAATLGSGGSLGFEGPSLYLGAVIGSAIQTRWSRLFTRDDTKVLMVAGAAAGVAAIFKAPATGAVFAMEVPYRDDTARWMLLPSLVGAAMGYLTFVALLGTAPLFEVEGSPPFDLRELGGAVVLGIVCGLGARGFARLIRLSKRLSSLGHPLARIAIASGVLMALLVLSHVLFDDTLSSGSGYRVLDWLGEAEHSIGLIVALLIIRVVATTTTLAAGGVGGLFIPLVVAGALVGDATSTALDDPSSLFPLIGVAAFLGAGYRTPLAGVMFVAEATGRPGFVVPGLIASVAAQLVMGNDSVSAYQSAGRVGHLERRFQLPIAAALTSDVRAVPPDATIQEFYDHHLLLTRKMDVPVLDGNQYLGMISVENLALLPPEEWPTTTVAEALDSDWPTGAPDWRLEQAIRTMDGAGIDTLPVVDGPTFVGVVSTSDIVRLDEILGDREVR